MGKEASIVVIDDEVEICSFLKDLLTAEGYTVFTACDPVEGLWKVEKLRPDLVMLDLRMPRMNGIEVLRRIRKIDAAITVIIITGFGTVGSARDAMRLGAFAYITKPFNLAEVRALVKAALGHE